MKFIIPELISALLFCSIATTALADHTGNGITGKKPKRADVAPAHKIIKMYQGKTDLWSTDCNGGIYFSPLGQARAWCADKSGNLGAGTWTADSQGRLCHNLNWYWQDGQRSGKSSGGEECIAHIIDRGGSMWRSWPNSSEWWPMREHSGLVHGYKFQDEVRQTRALLGF